LKLVADAAITSDELRRHFVVDPEASARGYDPIVMEGLKVRRGGTKRKSGRLPVPATREAERIKAEVVAFNAFAAAHCVAIYGRRTPLRWQRQFNLNFALHGRWYSHSGYQGLNATERTTRITIDGLHVLEIDLSASWLTCLYGHLNEPFDARHDPYSCDGISRDIAKAWVVASLGKGAAIMGKTWPQKMRTDALKRGLDLSSTPPRAIASIVLMRHPILRDLPERFAHLAKRFGVERPQDVFAHFLMGLEAVTLTDAMLQLQRRGVIALPVHDSLVVPQGAVEITKAAMTTAFQRALGVTPRLKVVGNRPAYPPKEFTPEDPEWWE
jgi:hypothetical protein